MRVLIQLGICSAGLVGLVASCGPANFEQTTDSDAGLEITRDIVYGHKFGMALTFDVLRPAQQNGAGVVFFNSGSYVSPYYEFLEGEGESLSLRDPEELENARHFSPWALLEEGFTVFNLRHGSSPKFVLPEVVEDVRRAVRVIRETAPDYGVSPDRLGLWGGSAGGHLALLLATSPEIGPDSTEVNPDPAHVAAAVAYYPPSELSTQRDAAARWIEETYGVGLLEAIPALEYSEELDPELSPVTYVTPDDPPILIIHGDEDLLVPLGQGMLIHHALIEAGVEATLLVVPGAAHGFLGEDAEFALAQSLGWFRRFLLDPS